MVLTTGATLGQAGISGGKRERRMRAMATVVGAAAIGQWVACAQSLTGLTAGDVVQRMMEMDRVRAASLSRYSAERRYIADNRRFSKHAEVQVAEWFAPPDRKELRVISASGSPAVQHRVIDKLIEAELDSVRKGNREQTHVNSENYRFRLTGMETVNGYRCYVLEITPKVEQKYLMVGRIWVDATDFAIVQMEGRPAKNPSFWTRSVHFVRNYQKHGSLWLPASVESESKILIAGKSSLKIEYTNYRIESERRLESESGVP
jgi:hypothetical protein